MPVAAVAAEQPVAKALSLMSEGVGPLAVTVNPVVAPVPLTVNLYPSLYGVFLLSNTVVFS